MLKWIKSWATPSPSLSDILSSRDNRETLLGVLDQISPSQEQIERDVNRVINYSNSTDYEIFAKEAWSEAIKYIDKMTDSNLTVTQVNFYRGKLSSTLDLLRVSYMARNARKQIDMEKKQTITIN